LPGVKGYVCVTDLRRMSVFLLRKRLTRRRRVGGPDVVVKPENAPHHGRGELISL
jgi:hypothetical protein